MERDPEAKAVERRIPYQPALDGMRGLAVAAVLAYHAGLPWARGGFLGVDAFFVLSGYLITSLLLSEWRASGSINLLAFWARRARRLLPALFLVLVGVALYAVVFAQPEELARLREDALATIGYVANWRPIFAGESYFDQFSVPSPLRHTWSLAIEEQWYVVWPVLAIVLLRLRRGSLATLLGVSLVLAAGSALLMAWLYDPQSDPSRVYYGTDTRAQSLLVGAVLAVLVVQHGPALAGRAHQLLQLAAIVAVAYIGWMWVTASDDTVFLYRGGFLLLALAVAVVIVATMRPAGGPLSRILSFEPLRGLGLISYGVYLWHWPIYLVLTPDRTGWDGYGLFAVRVLLTLVVALASYQLLEMPFRRGAFRWSRASWALAPAAAAVLVLGLVLVTRGAEPPFGLATSEAPPPPPSVSEVLSSSEGAASSQPVRVLVVGDSVALTMGLGLVRAESELDLSVWSMGAVGCGVLRGDTVLIQGEWTKQRDVCKDWPEKWQSYVNVFQPDVVVVLVGAWDLYDREIDSRLLEFGTPEADAFALSELDLAVDVLSSRGATVMLLTTPYFEERNLALNRTDGGFDPERIDSLNSLFATLDQQRDGTVGVIDLNDFVSSAGKDGDGSSDIDLRYDGVHFTPEGADLIARWLAPQLGVVARLQRTGATETASLRGARWEDLTPARWLELLAHVPDTSAARSGTAMNDYVRYRSVFAVPLPEPSAGEDELFEYYQNLLFDSQGKHSGLAPASVTGVAKFPPRIAETQALFGFTIADVDQDVWVLDGGRSPWVQVLRGRFDEASAVGSAIGSELPGTSNSAGSGDEHSFVQGQAIVRGEYLYSSSSVAGLITVLDAAAGEHRSLADVETFQLLASGLDRLDTYTALFSESTESYSIPEMAKRLAGEDPTDEELAATEERLGREGELLPFEAYATGLGVDARGSYIAIVLLNESDAAAQENGRRLQTRINEGASRIGGQPFREFIGEVEVIADGRLLLAKLRTEKRQYWYLLHILRDSLLLHE